MLALASIKPDWDGFTNESPFIGTGIRRHKKSPTRRAFPGVGQASTAIAAMLSQSGLPLNAPHHTSAGTSGMESTSSVLIQYVA